MVPELNREVAVTLRLDVAITCPDGLSPVYCLACRHPLDIHQPDPARPDRMLGTCDDCGRWHVIDCQPDDGSAVLAMLPDRLVP